MALIWFNKGIKMFGQSQTGKINWAQAFAEVSLILVGAFIAIMIDAWWDERSERQEEVNYLHALKADFINTKAMLENEIKDENAIQSLGKEIHLKILAGLGTVEPKEFARKVGDFYHLSGWMPTTGTYDEMVGSGRFLYLQNKNLRIKLAAFMGGFEQTQIAINYVWDNFYLTHDPFLRKHFIMSDLGWIVDYIPETPFNYNLAAIPEREFYNLITDFMVMHNDVLFHQFEPAVKDINEIIDLLEDEISLKAAE